MPASFPAQAQPQEPLVRREEGPLADAAQLLQPGIVSGTVIDETGAVVVGARVTLTRAAPFARQEAVSGEYGQFSFRNVLPGTFQIVITASRFAAHTLSGILHSGQSYIVAPTTLAPATLHTEIKVTAPPVEVAAEQLKAQEKQRVLGVLPNFYISYVGNAAPLNSKQKFTLAWKAMIDPVTVGLTAATAGVQQANDDFAGYGPGAQGYAKRLAAGYADNATGTFIGGAILPSLLKQDPRYFYKGTGSTRSRILYAVTRSVICKGDNQRWQPNYSAIMGSLASGGISNLYYPEKDRGAGLVLENTLIGIGETSIVNVFQEFVIHHFTTHAPKRDPSKP
jgi:hypothetical protein